MSHPSTAQNGGSLEDCHTNLFALTDLSGIKWRKLTASSYPVEPLDDPVLVSFTRCMRSDILCAWRRMPRNSPGPLVELMGSKELWIFWYGDEPSNLNSLLSKDLQESDQGSWDNGLNYDCRTVLFKALHNLIERCLLSHHFVRIGRWFVQPHGHSGPPSLAEKSSHLSIKFSFFLHGESTVCASIDVRQHPPLHTLHPSHLMVVPQTPPPGLQVILAPYGLSGTLTGNSCKDNDSSIMRLLDEWRQYFFIHETDPYVHGDNRLPMMVEVLVSGVRMKFPSCFVLVSAETEAELSRIHGAAFTQSLHSNVPAAPTQSYPGPPTTSPVTPGPGSVLGNSQNPADGKAPPPLLEYNDVFEPLIDPEGSCALGQRIAEKVWQDSTMTSGLHQNSRQQQTTEGSSLEEQAQWDYGDPMQKNACLCSSRTRNKARAQQKSSNTNCLSPNLPGKHKIDKMEKEKSRHSRGSTPFHRRNAGLEEMYDADFMMCQQSVPPSGASMDPSPGNFKSSPEASSNGPQNPAPQLPSSFNTPAAADSPSSAGAPSPLAAPQVAPAAHQNPGEMTMPTLSPHPPACKPGAEKDSSTDLSAVSGACINQSVNAPCAPIDSCSKTTTVVTVSSTIRHNGPSAPDMVASSSFSPWLNTQLMKHTRALAPKRPALPVNGYDQVHNELVTDSLYNFESLNDWLDQPVKKIKTEMEHTASNGLSPFPHSSLPLDPLSPMPQIPKHDPYEFSEESSASAAPFGNKLSRRQSRDDAYSRPSPFAVKQEDEPRRRPDGSIAPEDCNGRLDVSPQPNGMNGPGNGNMGQGDGSSASTPSGPNGPQNNISISLTSEVGLRPCMTDLEKLFDTDESEGSDADLAPISSPTIKSEDAKPTGGKSLASSIVHGAGPTPHELAKMFPTPPSLENQHNANSPPQDVSNGSLGPSADHVERPLHMKEPHHMPRMSQHHPAKFHHSSVANVHADSAGSKDWSFVNKPPTACMFLSSSKYSPIEVPSNRMEQLVYPLGSVDSATYKPSWTQPYHHALPVIDKHPQAPARWESMPHNQSTRHSPHSSQYLNVPSIENPSSARTPAVPDTSPAAANASGSFHSMVRTPRTPMSYELHSPASNASSYMNQNMKSVDNHLTNSQLPEAHSLIANIYLSDSLLNLFKDLNFNSCPICVCNNNIKGADVGTYLPDRSTEPQFRCMCGFSAAVNRTYGYNSGLFYEDEVDITDIRNDRFDRRKPSLLNHEDKEEKEKAAVSGEVVPQDILCLLQDQFSTLFPSPMVLHSCLKQNSALAPTQRDPINVLELADGCESVYSILEVARQAIEHSTSHGPLSDHMLKHQCLSKWPFLKTAAKVPINSQDVVRMLKSLQPLLQDAIQKKRTARAWESVYTISGPLSWKDFHLLAGRGSEERSEPQPIPSLTLCNEKDSLSVGPHAIKYWDKMMLEPYSHQRNAVYVVVAPDNDYVLRNVDQYFTELSLTYEQCRLGKHRPVKDGVMRMKDGIIRIGKNVAGKVSDVPVVDWFKLIGNSPVASKLRLYAQVCSGLLAPFLSKELSEKGGTFDSKTNVHGTPRPSPKTEGSDSISHPPHSEHEERREGEVRPESHEPLVEHDLTGELLNLRVEAEDPPSLVIYMIDPFSYGQEWDDLKRLAMLGILRCFHDMLATLPEALRENTQLQIVPQQSLIDCPRAGSAALRAMSLSVYSQCKRLLKYSTSGTSLTGFGPLASAEKLLRTRDTETGIFKLYTSPFVLTRERKKLPLADPSSIVEKTEKGGVLFCGYCLSEDQRWLLASCTDSFGELLETCVINIEIPNRNRRKKASARRIGLSKLWDFILGVVSQTSIPWRLVVGRFGRLGHGELKGWAGLLSKKNLHVACRHLRETCNMCNVQGPNEMPQIVSACLVSMENHSSMHIMTDSIKMEMEERRSSSAQIHTPRDASCTHILVFPTSTTAQAGSSERPVDNHMSLADDGLGDVFDIGDDEELLPGINDVFNFFGDEDKQNSPSGSPTHGMGGHGGMHHNRDGLPMESISDAQDDIGNLHQQPLAMGFYASTAKPGRLPKWFWSAEPQREEWCPAVFKAALHIHLAKSQPGSGNDDFGSSVSGTPSSKDNHPLDSTFTCDVLRYVLETYNALSWLTMDVTTGDRRSCLPAHFVVLMQLYQALNAYV